MFEGALAPFLPSLLFTRPIHTAFLCSFARHSPFKAPVALLLATVLLLRPLHQPFLLLVNASLEPHPVPHPPQQTPTRPLEPAAVVSTVTTRSNKMVNPLVIEPLGKHTASIIFSQLRTVSLLVPPFERVQADLNDPS